VSTKSAIDSSPGRTRGRPRAPEVSDAIINATVDLLAEGGLEAATIEAIAARAGVGRPSIYRRWGSRDVLISDVMVMASNRDVPVPNTGSLRADLLTILDGMITILSEPLGRASVALIGVAAGLPVGPDESGSQRERRTATQVIVQRAKDRGELPQAIDADHLLDMVAAPVWMTLLVWRRPLSTIDTHAIVDTVLDGVLVR
jgi:AcrR family transcriptional regulator